MARPTLMAPLALAAAAVLANPAAAQKMPQASPHASVTQRIGLNDVTITYSRPGVKGRKVWGDLVPYGKMWRTGANEATTISFGEDVLVEGQALAAGTYALFTVPGEKEWALVFSKNAKQWGAYGHKDSEEALRVKVAPRPASDEEWMSFRFRDVSLNGATAVLAWEKLEVPFKLQNKVDTNATVLNGLREKIKTAKPDEWQPLTDAASYCVDQKTNLDEAAAWLDKSLAIKKTTFSHFVKARLLEGKGKVKDGIAELEAALKVAGPDDDKEFLEEIRGMIAGWKKKA